MKNGEDNIRNGDVTTFAAVLAAPDRPPNTDPMAFLPKLNMPPNACVKGDVIFVATRPMLPNPTLSKAGLNARNKNAIILIIVLLIYAYN